MASATPQPPNDVPSQVEFDFNDIYNQISVAIAVCCAAAILIWDHLHLFPHETKAYYSVQAPHWRVWDLSAFILMRYLGIGSMIGFLYLHAIPTSQCGVVWSFVQAAIAIISALSSFLVSLRIGHMLWGNHKLVLLGLATLSLGVLLVQTPINAQLHVQASSRFVLLSRCTFDPFPKWSSIPHVAWVVFYTFCLALGLAKRREKQAEAHENSHLEACLLYLLLATIANCILFGIQVQPEEHQTLKEAAFPFSVFVSVASAGRIALGTRSLRQHNHRKKLAFVPAPINHGSPSPKASVMSLNPISKSASERSTQDSSYFTPRPSTTSSTTLRPEDQPSTIDYPFSLSPSPELKKPYEESLKQPATPTSRFSFKSFKSFRSSSLASPMTIDSPIEFASNFTADGRLNSPSFPPNWRKRAQELPKNPYTSFPSPPPSVVIGPVPNKKKIFSSRLRYLSISDSMTKDAYQSEWRP